MEKLNKRELGLEDKGTEKGVKTEINVMLQTPGNASSYTFTLKTGNSNFIF